MKLETKNVLSDAQKVIITGLWNAEYPKQLNFNGVTGFEEFLNRISNLLHFLLLNEDGELKGWLMTFTRQDERWFSVIVDGKERQKGFGTRLLEELKKSEDEISGWAIEHDNYLKNDGENYRSPIGFYQKNGFAILSEMRLETEDYDAVKIKWTKE